MFVLNLKCDYYRMKLQPNVRNAIWNCVKLLSNLIFVHSNSAIVGFELIQLEFERKRSHDGSRALSNVWNEVQFLIRMHLHIRVSTSIVWRPLEFWLSARIQLYSQNIKSTEWTNKKFTEIQRKYLLSILLVFFLNFCKSKKISCSPKWLELRLMIKKMPLRR